MEKSIIASVQRICRDKASLSVDGAELLNDHMHALMSMASPTSAFVFPHFGQGLVVKNRRFTSLRLDCLANFLPFTELHVCVLRLNCEGLIYG